MAIAVELNFPDATLDQDDQVIARMGFQPSGPGGPGSLFHRVMKTDHGVRVVDVWGNPPTSSSASLAVRSAP
jgi:hypothetical protein